MERRKIQRYGWRPDLPDHRDYLLAPEQEVDIHRLPARVDLRESGHLFFPVYDQGQLGSCTANATAAGLRFSMSKQNLTAFDPSRLYIYYKEREIEGSVESDAGAMIRDGMKVVAKGFVSEDRWAYDIETFATPPRPIAELDAEASKDHVISYLRVPRGMINPSQGMQACLAAGYPFLFGISVYESFEQATNGTIPLPSRQESLLGGHALLCVGYDQATKLYVFRNSWGTNWGQAGYGTIPFDYLHSRALASDFWTIRKESIAA